MEVIFVIRAQYIFLDYALKCPESKKKTKSCNKNSIFSALFVFIQLCKMRWKKIINDLRNYSFANRCINSFFSKEYFNFKLRICDSFPKAGCTLQNSSCCCVWAELHRMLASNLLPLLLWTELKPSVRPESSMSYHATTQRDRNINTILY